MKEILVNERVFEGLMRGEGIDGRNERKWWGIYPNQYKIMEDGSLKYKDEVHTERKPSPCVVSSH